MADRHLDRFNRQIQALGDRMPLLRPVLSGLQGRPLALVRLPLALFLIAGSLLAILPVFGIWMLTLGLVLLAIDLPLLRPVVSSALIRSRRRLSIWQRNWKTWRANRR